MFQSNKTALFTYNQLLEGPNMLTSKHTDEVLDPNEDGQYVSATVAVKVQHMWDGNSWYRFKHGVFIDGEWKELVTNKDREDHVGYLAQNEDDDKIEGLMQQYDTDNINYQTSHSIFDMDMMNKWKEHAVDIEAKFKAILSLGIIDFPPQF